MRVYDAQGREVDNLDVSHPEGNQHWLGGRPEGASAGRHLGHASASTKFTVAGLMARNETGQITKLTFGVVRSLNYISIALMLSGVGALVSVRRRAGVGAWAASS